MFALLLLKSVIIHLLTNQRLAYAQAQPDSANSSETCICNSNICASCSIFIMCSSATSTTTYSNACQLSGYNSCKSSCPFKPSEGILYLQSQCLSTQNCSLIFSCGNNSSSIYLPCQSNSDSTKSTSSSGCLYCFKSSAAGLTVPMLGKPAVSTAILSSSTTAIVDSITAPTLSLESKSTTHTTTESISMFTSESTTESILESTTYITTLTIDYILLSTSESIKESSTRTIQESTTESIVKSKSITHTITESISLFTSESTLESATESISMFTSESTLESTTESILESTTYITTLLSTSESIKESSTRTIQESTTESIVKSFAGYLPDSTTVFIAQSTTEAITVPTSLSFSNSNSDSETTISAIFLSTIIPGALLLLVIIIFLCKRHKRSKRRSVLPGQDTLHDFEGTLDDLKDMQNISSSNLHGDMLLFSKAASEKTILIQEIQDINNEKFLGKLEAQPFFSVMNNIYMPNGRLKPVPVKTQDSVSIKPLDPEMEIPELSFDKKRKNIKNESKAINAGFFKRMTHEFTNSAQVQDNRIAAQIQDNRIDAPLLIYEKPNHIMIPKKFKNFEKRPSAGVAKCNLEDGVIIIDESNQH